MHQRKSQNGSTLWIYTRCEYTQCHTTAMTKLTKLYLTMCVWCILYGLNCTECTFREMETQSSESKMKMGASERKTKSEYFKNKSCRIDRFKNYNICVVSRENVSTEHGRSHSHIPSNELQWMLLTKHTHTHVKRTNSVDYLKEQRENHQRKKENKLVFVLSIQSNCMLEWHETIEHLVTIATPLLLFPISQTLFSSRSLPLSRSLLSACQLNRSFSVCFFI